MKPKNIILLRHAESLGNADKEIYSKIPTHALGVTEKGKSQAQEAAKKIIDITGTTSALKTYVSPYKRTRETLQELQKTSLNLYPIYEDPRLREQDHGHLRNDEEREKLKKECFSYSQFYYRFPNGESGADVYSRVSSFLESLHRSFTDNFYENYLIITHGLTAKIFLMRWFHKTVEEYESWDHLENCGMYIMHLNSFSELYEFPLNINYWKDKE